ncbi:uncharacterized protein LOC121411386 isoform X1 [Lytechinus variegatus]|uniref:uncharacterized protein LOC121411386 isoform X1 n=1 Tax=Lytechinus variegatus TaxID=7654 RepID=UPI001BB28763|nr:uncharacterized protein LOC121411386 isoform X1 [Lytechinus variegatus]
MLNNYFIMFSLSTSSQTKTFQFDPSRGIDFENDIKILRRSRLTKLSEFMTMLLSAERFQRDAKLSSLTRKDKNQLAQQAEDAQFFRILLRMLMEVSRASGLKQRDDLKKVYHWYQLNKEVLHCEPHFKGAGKQLYKRPELKFSADAIKFYSDPPGRRKNNQVTFQMTSQQSSPRVQGSDEFDDLRIDTSRPKTAPSSLNRPKIHNSLRSPRSGDDDASFAVNYINSYLNNHLTPMATKLDRPTSAMSVIRHAQIASQQRNEDEEGEVLVGDRSAHSQAASLASDSNISIQVPDRKQDGEEKKDENEDDGSVKMEDDGEDAVDGEKEEEGPGLFKRKPPLTSLVNPVAQATFEEESFHGALAPEISEGTLLRVQVDMPKATASKQSPGPSEAEKKAAYLQQWHDYQQQQGMTAGDGTPSVDNGERVVTTEVPERFTQEVLANYAAQESFVTDNAPRIPANSLASQSLENFYKMTDNHEPKVDQNPISAQSALRLQKAQEAKKVTISEETSHNTRQRALSARIERPSSVQAGSLVMLADHVGDNMMVEKEPNGPEAPAGFRRPSSKVPPKRPATAPSSKPVSVSVPKSYGGMSPPPNSSGDSTPEYTPRNRRGEPIFTLPEESDYNVHFRRQGQTPVSATIPHSISRLQGSTVPDTARYKWRDDGYGNMTYRKIHSRIQSAPAQRTSLRTAGSTRGGNRPRTASEASAKKKWHPCKVCEDSIRLPQAASHRMRTMHPATVASMMSIKTLEGDNRRMRSRMGHRHTGTYPWEEEPVVTANEPPNMQYMSISTPAAIKVRNATDGSKAPNQSTESLVPKDSLRSPSRDSSRPSPVQGWFMGDSSAGETTTVADGPPSNQGGDNNSSTVMAPSERSFGEMSDGDLADLTDQTLSPADTPRTIDSGEYRPKSRVDLSVGNSSGVFGQEIHVPQADVDSGSPDLATKEAEDSVEGTPRSDIGNGSVGDTPRSDSKTGQAENVEVTSSDTTPRETVIKGEPDQTGFERIQPEEAGPKSAEAEAVPTGSEENGAKQEESDTEQDTLPSVPHSFKAQAVEPRPPSSSSSSSTIHAMPDHAHSFVPVEKHDKTSHHQHHQRQHPHPHGNHQEHPQDGHQGAKVVSLDLDVNLYERSPSPASTNTPHHAPTAYMKLSEAEKKKLKGQHPTAATNIPEYLLMMPAVSSKPLTPHSSRPTTPRSVTSRTATPRSPRVSPATSPCPRNSRSPSPSFRSRSPSMRSRSPSIRSHSPSIRTPSPVSVNGRLSPNVKTSSQGHDSVHSSRSPSPTLSTASQSLRPKSAGSRVTSARQREPPASDTVMTEETREGSDQGGTVGAGDRSNLPVGLVSGDGERSSSPMGLVSESRISITAEDEEVSAITDTYDDLGIIDDDGVSLSPCTPDNFSQQDGFSSGATSPSITITMATSDQPSTVPQILVKRPSSAPGIRSDEGHSSLRLSAEECNGGGGSRPSSARGRRPVSARRAASPQPRRPTSPRPTSPRFTRPVSPRSKQRGSQWEGRPVPAFGHSNPEAEYESYQKQQEAKNSVQIQKLFNKSSTKEAKKRLSQAERARQEKMGREAFESERAYLEHLWRREVALYKRDDITFKNFEKEYMLDKLNRSKLRQEKRNMLLQEQAAENRRQMALLKRIGPSVDIHELFNAQSRGVSKAVMKRAAISIQRFVRGMIIRKMLAKVKEKSRIHAGSFKSFIKYYYNLMKKIARWHGVKKPRIHLDLWQMEEFMDKKKYYEYIFSKRIHPETQMPAKDLPSYLKECDHHPSQREINNAILGATKKDFTKPNLMLKEREVSEIVFMIYVPRGTGLEAKNVRKSTWLNPLVDGEEARKMMGTDEVKNVELSKSLQLVFNSMQERKEQKMYEDRIRKREEEKKRLEMEEQEKEEEQEKKLIESEGKGEETDEKKKENESEVKESCNEKE